MLDSTQNRRDDFRAFKDARILMGGSDFQIENGPERILFQGKLEIGCNQVSRNTLSDLIWVLASIRDAIPVTVSTVAVPVSVPPMPLSSMGKNSFVVWCGEVESELVKLGVAAAQAKEDIDSDVDWYIALYEDGITPLEAAKQSKA